MAATLPDGDLMEINGVGTAVASQLLVTIGDNPERQTSEAQFAALTGTAPIPASSGKTTRHRLSRGGDRASNAAIHRIVLARMANDQRTREYVDKRRPGQGQGQAGDHALPQALRGQEVYHVLRNPRPAPLSNDLRPCRLALRLTQVRVARDLGTWSSAISRLERAQSRDRDLNNRYRHWLEEQPKISA